MDENTQSRASMRSRIPHPGLREMNPATTNSRSGILPPGSIANKGSLSPTRPKPTNAPEPKKSASASRQPVSATNARTRGNSFASSTTRVGSTTTRSTNGSFSNTMGYGSRPVSAMSRPASAMSRPNSSLSGRKTPGASIQRPATSLDTHAEDGASILGKRKGTEWNQERKESDMEQIMNTLMAKMNEQGQHSSGLKETVELYKSRINDLESARDKLTDANASLRCETDALKNQLNAAEAALKDARREQEIAMDELDRRQRIEVESVSLNSRKEMEELKARQQDEMNQLRRKFESEIEIEKAMRVRELEQLTSRSALDTQKAEIELERKDREITMMNNQLLSLKADLDRERKTTHELRQNLDTAGSNGVTLESTIRALKARIEFLEGKASQEETMRRKLHNQVQELKGNIRVFCRVRPSLKSEPPSEITPMEYPDESEEAKEINVMGPEEKNSLGSVSRKNNTFSFDRVFGPSATNTDVFDEISQLVQSALDGYNVCIFCYGQTGSGKTHTMSSQDGMIPLAVHQIYETAQGLEEKGWRYKMTGNFVEVYNENVNDLLGNPDELDKKKHEIRHDMQRGKTTITDINTVDLDSPEMVKAILKNADANRSVAATKANERSSRSHSVFILKLIGENHITGERSEGTLNLVDLAGSERLSHSQATGERLKETQNINRSLSSLGDVIAALGQGKEGGHIPYRNSKLTYLLQFSLGGNSKTLMFVMVSPLQAHLSETLTSLKFATKVSLTHIGTAKKQSRIRD
ncbi:uncharacterized protein N7477_005304 [Penicillium maclennaniae]|uniref:uncharacterized protein n=1 Tax=Penicillium maclennaniae TaxID=1343394 RepID=UPI0025408897|nr:uncharacterized protein N7477_005304 [Penicillium maclennaniae]KAJ5669941.1 hypothetical protein N7477_005304 [Penicillium maclennaniae]